MRFCTGKILVIAGNIGSPRYISQSESSEVFKLLSNPTVTKSKQAQYKKR